MRHSIHSRIQFKTKLIYILSSAGNFSPVSFAIPFFSLTNFVGLFSFQLLTFVCRTPRLSTICRKSSSDTTSRGRLSASQNLKNPEHHLIFVIVSRISLSMKSGHASMTVCTTNSSSLLTALCLKYRFSTTKQLKQVSNL